MFNVSNEVACFLLGVYRISELMDELKFTVKQNHELITDENDLLKKMIDRDGIKFLKQAFLNYALYGYTVGYFTKSIASFLQNDSEELTPYQYRKIIGIYCINSYALSPDFSNQDELSGMFVSNPSGLSSRNYLKRDEFVYCEQWHPYSKSSHINYADIFIGELKSIAGYRNLEKELYLLRMEFINNPDQFAEHFDKMDFSLLPEHIINIASYVLGIEQDLIIGRNKEGERYTILKKRTIHDTVMPFAVYLTDCLNRDMDLPEDISIQIEYMQPELA
mgnify:CR=1 FL=1